MGKEDRTPDAIDFLEFYFFHFFRNNFKNFVPYGMGVAFKACFYIAKNPKEFEGLSFSDALKKSLDLHKSEWGIDSELIESIVFVFMPDSEISQKG
jgi:hypothetical protein